LLYNTACPMCREQIYTIMSYVCILCDLENWWRQEKNLFLIIVVQWHFPKFLQRFH
jgi:hypothetical protein